MQKTRINWGIKNLYTFNPVTGCKRQCPFCYARRIHERFNKTPFTDIVFHPDRIREPFKLKKPATVFVGSMSDIEYWKKEWINEIISVCRACPQHGFMFLSKNPVAYFGYIWPKNTMQGLTMTCEQDQETQLKLTMTMIRHLPRTFLSIEPLLGELKINSTLDMFEKIIVGAMTGVGAVKPKPEWVQSVKDCVPADKIFWKDSMREYL